MEPVNRGKFNFLNYFYKKKNTCRKFIVLVYLQTLMGNSARNVNFFFCANIFFQRSLFKRLIIKKENGKGKALREFPMDYRRL